MLRLYRREGRGNWYVRGSINGLHANESTGTNDKANAKQYADKIAAEMWERSLVPGRRGVKFKDAARGYLNGKSRDTERCVLRLVDLWAERDVADIGQIDFDEVCTVRGLGPASANRVVFSPGAAVLHWAARRGHCPWIRLHRPKEQRTRERQPPTPEQVNEILLRLRAHPEARAAIIFMAHTGARVSDMCGLQWDDVDLPRQHVSLWVFKTRERRPVPLSDDAFAALANLPRRTDGYVFRWRTRWAFYSLWRGAQGETKFRLHDLRHAFATWLRQQGRDLKFLMAMGGWKDHKSVTRYAHVSSAELIEGAKQLPKLGQPLSGS